MSDTKEPRKAQTSINGQSTIYKPRPKLEDSTEIDVAQIKLEYMEHPKVGFSDFCEAMQYNVTATKHRVPYIAWMKEKKHALAKAKLEQIADRVFEAGQKLPMDMLTAISENSTLASLARSVLKNKLVSIAQQQRDDPEFTKTQDTYELVALANAVHGVIKASKEANFMQDISIKLAEDLLPKNFGELSHPDPAIEAETGIQDGQGTWKVRLIGIENPEGKTAAQFDEMLGVNTDGERQSEADGETVPSADE